MDRRSFLIGSSTILTSAFVDKADWFLRNEKAVVPFEEVKQAVNKLYFVSVGVIGGAILGHSSGDIVLSRAA